MTVDTAPSELARAWHSLSGERLDAGHVELVRRSRGTTVFRLRTRDGPIVAKCCPTATAALECAIYEHVLSGLPIPTLRFHGAVAASDRRLRWLFIEDASGERFEPSRKEHRCAAARWLAMLHRAVADHPARRVLPGRRPDHYARLLRSVLRTLRELQTAARATGGDRPIEIGAVIAHCERLCLRWNEIEEACATLPDTLVHGDVVTHNANVRNGSSTLEFVPFDWEKAGWGTAAEDLSDVDIDCYRGTVEAAGGEVDRHKLTRLAGAGKAFRCLVFLQWLAPELRAGSEDAFEQLGLCRSWLDAIVESRPWAA